MRYGYFDDRAKEYVIARPDTATSWSNYLGSTEFGAIITNNAGGYGFFRSGGARALFALAIQPRAAGSAWSLFLPARPGER